MFVLSDVNTITYKQRKKFLVNWQMSTKIAINKAW
jgi:hypothetical protein